MWLGTESNCRHRPASPSAEREQAGIFSPLPPLDYQALTAASDQKVTYMIIKFLSHNTTQNKETSPFNQGIWLSSNFSVSGCL